MRDCLLCATGAEAMFTAGTISGQAWATVPEFEVAGITPATQPASEPFRLERIGDATVKNGGPC